MVYYKQGTPFVSAAEVIKRFELGTRDNLRISQNNNKSLQNVSLSVDILIELTK